MDFQTQIQTEAAKTHELGKQLFKASENEDLQALRGIAYELRGVATALDSITFFDKTARAEK